ncbi:hypothetical protein Prum_089080 [Phytohabitans rumicis]|uniref:Uncharacterized protein n=1 Tax=Phytohabitans rumicis TaxID=1076125 RepID=A0A6V8LM64_9ACTN|nr:hypothetical protein Prum_089080 [Phytohabitans rumicis]
MDRWGPGPVRLLTLERGPLPLGPDLKALLRSQWEDASHHRYQFFDGHAPALPKIYVEQRVERSARGLVTGQAGVPGLLTVREVFGQHADAFPNVLVVSGPGMGKSTLAAQLVYEQCAWWLAARRNSRPDDAPFGAAVPIALPARYLVGRSLPDALLDATRRLAAGADGVRFDDHPLPGVPWLVLVDGLDEVLRPHERSQVLGSLTAWLSDDGAPFRFFVTTRPLPYGELADVRSRRVGEFVLRPFSETDIRTFATNWFLARAPEQEARTAADLFGSRLLSARLRNVVRVPLLATIAALVFESDQDQPLPTSRAGLYERFVEHLVDGRRQTREQLDRLAREFKRSGAAGAQAWQWLRDNRMVLLEHLADAYLTGAVSPITARAETWVASHAPAQAFDGVPGWKRHLRAVLTSTGVLAPHRGDLAFTHHSLAEYLGAGPRAKQFESATWFADVRSPESRNLALFVLARSLAPADPLVQTLLDSLGADVVAAGDVLADGIDVSVPLRRRVIDALIGQLTAEDPTAPEALRVLVDLLSDKGLANRLVGIVEDDTALPWARVLVADALDQVDGQSRYLRRMAQTPALELRARAWAFQQLRRRGGEHDADAPATDVEPEPGLPERTPPGPLARHAYRLSLENQPRGSAFRLTSALALAGDGSRAGEDELHSCVTDTSLRMDLRLEAARALVRVGPEHGEALQRVLADAGLGVDVRIPVAVALTEVNDESARELLREMAAQHPALAHSLPAVHVALDTVRVERRVQERPVVTVPTEAESVRIWAGVPIRNPDFTGREDLLERLREALQSSSRAVVRPQTLQGMGGVGKTQLVLEYVYRFAADYDIVCWVPAEQRSSVVATLAELAPRLGLPVSEDRFETARVVLDALAVSPARWLLVLDNADDPDIIEPLVPAAGGHVVLTSRNQEWAQVWDSIEVDVFRRDESVELLRRRADVISVDDADRLAERLGDLPLALDQAATWQAATGMPIAEYLQLLDEHIGGLLSEGRPTSYPVTVAAFVGLALEKLRAISPAAAQVMELFAFLAPEPISVAVLRRGRDAAMSEPLHQLLGSAVPLSRAIRELRRYGLAKVDPDQRMQVHRLVRLVMRDRLSPERYQEARSNVHRLLASANPASPDDPAAWRTYAEIGPHVLAAELIDADDEDARRVVLDQIRYLWVTGDYEGARRVGETAVAEWRTHFGSDAELTLLAALHLADALRSLGEYQAARALTTDAFERLRATRGEDHEFTFQAMRRLGADLRIAGELRAAYDLEVDNLARHSRVLGDEDAETQRARDGVATSLRLLGDFAEAYRIDRATASGWAEILGTTHLWTLSSQANVARDLYALGRYAEALELQRATWPAYRDQLGDGHIEVLLAARTIAIATRKLGRYGEALSLVQEHYRAVHALFRPDHEHVLAATTSYVNALRATDQLGMALGPATEAVSRYQRMFGERHPLTLAAATNLAIILRAQGDARAARELDEKTHKAMLETLGPDHEYTLCVANGVANDLALHHDLAGARELSARTLAISRRVRGDGHPYTLACAANAAFDLRATGDLAGGHALHNQALADLARVLGADHPEHLDAARGKRAECDIEPPPM